MSIMSKLTAAYMAGIVDGDGYLGIQKTHRDTFKDGIKYEVCIKIGMNNKEFIEWLKESFGGNIHERRFEDNRKTFYSWTIRGCKAIKPIIEKIYPYLKVKRKQGETLKKFLKTFYLDNYEMSANEGRGGVHREIKEHVRKEREMLYQDMRKLNQVGKVAA